MSRIIDAEPETETKTPYTPPPIRPIGDRVVVQADVVPELTKGGIALPNAVVGKRASRMGTVIAIGPGQLRVFPDTSVGGTGDRFPMTCKVGDRVIVPSAVDQVLMDVDVKDSELMIISESQILAILPQ
jgi:co-chaperonin GroES (HSP10)